MYNVIAKTIKAAKESAAQFQAIKDNTTAKMDALPINHLQMKNIKAASPRLVNITTALSLSIAQVMMMQDFEKTFRPEWKHKKKESVALREVFLKAKTKEIEKIQRDYKIETTKSLGIATHGKGVATAEVSIEGSAANVGEDTAGEKEATRHEVARPAVEGLQFRQTIHLGNTQRSLYDK
ncbi:hypothetical protein SNOG_10620 [Parastagonospora nodorum SN15]|uniref:Uncharacterized protein n=1 Tax=Phaeosphaeria nodorum (strain SN15 / ATCC MYA-4574 / FGSC 10173) TaxID=321614 RepID=Q0UC94_PHANO|nr:hypothetical protein SNOG_10620 [Parastagonospora nodorum SN15]EAT82014.2 hypothetical protein SNOG_10620 [Parastagonospora nodorum SN15]